MNTLFKSKKLIFSFALLTFLFAAIYLNASRSSSKLSSATTLEKISFSGASLNAGQIHLSDYYGKVVLINFWATWCPPCVTEIPHFVALQKEFGDRIQVIGISVDDATKLVSDFIQSNHINYPVILHQSSFDTLFGDIHSIPTTFILDKNLTIVNTFVGYRTQQFFKEQINALL